MASQGFNVDARGGAFNEVHGDQIVNNFHNDKLGANHFETYFVVTCDNPSQVSMSYLLLFMMLSIPEADVWPGAYSTLERMSSKR